MSWNPYPPAGLQLTGADLSQNRRYFHSEETVFCPGDGFAVPDATIPLALPEAVLEVFDTYAADNVSALAAYDLVQVYTLGGTSGGSEGGWPFPNPCESYHNGDPILPSYFSGVSVGLGGLTTELRSGDDGTSRPILNPTQANFAPLTAGLLMRPTALTWDGQDPTNDANRSVWLPSEVIGVLGAIHFLLSMGEVSGWDLYLGTGVRGLNVIEPGTAEPVICFV